MFKKFIQQSIPTFRSTLLLPWQSFIILFAFTINSFGAIPSHAQDYRLPTPGVMIHLSPPINPAILKGIKIHPENPFQFDFILDKGDSKLSNDQLKDESSKLIKYFLASLTIPEKDLWVNLSPYEKDRIIPKSFGLTEMGRDLLAEDYMLKQITASLIYPEDEIGNKFWKRIYEEAAKKYGTTDIPVNTFNKVWIVPEKAVVYENTKSNIAYVVESKLKVMLEQDYLSLRKHEGIKSKGDQTTDTSQLGSQIVREIIIPELTKEVNDGKNFSHLRQVYNSLILATWYKNKIKESLLIQTYTDKNKIAGININDPQEKNRIYQKYLKAFKLGVFNYIKDDIDLISHQEIPRKYFSGGVKFDLAMQSQENFSTHGLVSVLHSLPINFDTSAASDPLDILTTTIQAIRPQAPLKTNSFESLRNNSAMTSDLATLEKRLEFLPRKSGISPDQLLLDGKPLELLGHGGNTSVFKLDGKFAVRVSQSLGLPAAKEDQFKEFSAMGISPKFISKGITPEGYTYLIMELIDEKSVDKLGRELNEDEIQKMLNFFDLLISKGVLDMNLSPKSIVITKQKAILLDPKFATMYKGNKVTLAIYLRMKMDHWKTVDPNQRILTHLNTIIINGTIGHLSKGQIFKPSSFQIPRFNDALLGNISHTHPGFITKIADDEWEINKEFKDPAMVKENSTSVNNGGIDLTPVNEILQNQNTTNRINLKIDPDMLQEAQNAAGFTVGNITIQPLKDLLEFLGINKNPLQIY